MNVALYPKEWVERHVHSIGVRGLRGGCCVWLGWGARDAEAGGGEAGAGLEVGGGADAEAGGLLVEEAGRGQVLGG